MYIQDEGAAKRVIYECYIRTYS